MIAIGNTQPFDLQKAWYRLNRCFKTTIFIISEQKLYKTLYELNQSKTETQVRENFNRNLSSQKIYLE